MLISGIITTAINILTTHTLLTRRKSILYCFIAFILCILVELAVIIPSMLYIKDPLITKNVVFSASIVFIIYIHLVFEESIQKKIFTMLSIYILSTVSLYVSVITIRLFTHIIDGIHLDDFIYGFRILLELSALAAIYFKMKNTYKRILRSVPDRTAIFMSVYTLIANLVLLNDYPTAFPHFRYFDSLFEMLIFLILIVLGYLLVFEGISSASRMVSMQYNYRIVENQVELQRQNYRRLNESLEQLSALKHDVRHHFSAIKSMLNEKKYEPALKYIEQFNQNELSRTLPALCENFTVDSIIKYYFSIAKERNIDFIADLNIPEDISINPIDLCVVLGNCLENAIDACDKLRDVTEKYIRIASRIVNSYLVLQIVNSFDGTVKKDGETFLSTKNEAAHGIGLSSIKETVSRSRGNVDIKHTNHEFQVDIIMECPETL